MKNILLKNKGASMLLAICIFMFLVVLGFNVLAASSSNINNTSEQFENEQAMQYVNSIYEIVDGMIINNEVKLPDVIPNVVESEAFGEVTTGDFNAQNIGEVSIKFYRIDNSQIEVKTSVEYIDRIYTISSIYRDARVQPGAHKYSFVRCKGVESREKI